MELSLAFYITLYQKQTPKEKKLIHQLFYNQKVNKASFIKGKSLCKNAGCTSKTRQRLKRKNRDFNSLMFDCTPRFDKNGRQTTDQYVLNNNFKMALEWIEIRYGLNTSKRHYKKMISQIEREQKCPPPPVQNVPPLVKINLSRDRFKRTPLNPLKKEYINPQIAKVKIPKEDQIMLSMYPEFAISKTFEDVIFYKSKGYTIDKPIDFMLSRINAHLKKEFANKRLHV